MEILKPNYTWASSLESRPLEKVTHIILHHAAVKSATPLAIHNGHVARGWAGIGYHFYIRKDGSIYEGRPLEALGCHTSGMNGVSVGVCCEGNFENETMGAEQKKAVIEVVQYLLGLFPGAEIYRHKDFNATACPGSSFPFEEIKTAARLKKEDSDDKFDAQMTRWQQLRGKQEVPRCLKNDYEIAVTLGITDGSRPRALCTRAEAAVMAYRAVLEVLSQASRE